MLAGEKPENLTLPLHCQHCGQPVTLTYTPRDGSRTVAWTCPHPGCERLQLFDLQGSVARVVVRSAQE